MYCFGESYFTYLIGIPHYFGEWMAKIFILIIACEAMIDFNSLFENLITIAKRYIDAL